MQTLLLEDGLIVLLGAIVLDILFGEPRTYFHPAYLMRRSAVYFEPAFRKMGDRKLGGALLLLTISIIFVVPAALILSSLSFDTENVYLKRTRLKRTYRSLKGSGK